MSLKSKLLITFGAISFLLFVVFKNTEAFDFSRNLKLGDRGADVKALQIFLNNNPETLVAKTGVGSFGYETEYFGNLTLQAVKRFQEKYKNNILIPLGLYSPTGYVGRSTLAEIKRLQNLTVNSEVEAEKKIKITTPSVPQVNLEQLNSKQKTKQFTGVPIEIQTINTKISKPENLFREGASEIKYYDKSSESGLVQPDQSVNNGGANGSRRNTPLVQSNLDNFDEAKQTILDVGHAQGYSEKELNLAISVFRENAVSTTTNFMQEFERQMRETGSVAPKDGLSFGGFIKQVKDTLIEIFAPRAYALGRPFGAMVFYSTFCPCSGNWLVFMRPYNVGGPTMLTHYMGNQMYLNHNFPFSRYVLGSYIPGGAPCMMYAGVTCISIPSQGMTTGNIGTSM